MGVRFLESFLENQSNRSCYEVYIPKIVNEYRRRTGSVPVIVIDAMSCLRPLYKNLSWLNGGQFLEFYDIIQTLIYNFTQLGCELVAFFDGPVQDIKIPVWKKRRLNSAEEISNIFNNLFKGTDYIERVSRSNCLPNGLGVIFFFLFSQHKNCRVLKSIRECDEEIALYALKNKCFAILAQDTDYVIYQSAQYYLSIKNLNLQKMTTLCYDSYSLSKELGIHLKSFPLFASLMGNDIVAYDMLRDFHQRLKRKNSRNSNVLLVADYIRNLRHVELSKIAAEVFGSDDQAELLNKSIASYDLLKLSEYVEEEVPIKNAWQNIMQLAKKKFITDPVSCPLYDLIINGKFSSSTCLEDYRPTNIIVPVGNLLKELRRSIYGILLFEKPLDEGKESNCISELVMTGFESMENAVLVSPKYLEKVNHPGLMALWTSNDEAIQNNRWRILGEIFNATPSAIKQLPPWFLVPALATRYFKSQFPCMDNWELDAMIACNVCVRNYRSPDLRNLPSDPLTYRQIWMYTALTRTYSIVNYLLYCLGNPIEIYFTLPNQYTDGKLFHEKYRHSKAGTPQNYLCECRVESIEMFHLLRSFVLAEYSYEF